MLQTSNSDQPAQNASLMRVVILGKTISEPWEIYLAEDAQISQSFCSSHLSRDANQMFIINENKEYVYDKNAILTPDHVRC